MAMPKLINELPAASLGAGDLLAAKVAGVTSQVTITQLITEAATFTQSGTGAVARTVQDRLRSTVFITDFMSGSDSMAIAAGTTTNIDTAISNAHDCLPSTGGEIIFPPFAGKYKLTAAPTFTSRVVLRGMGATAATAGGQGSAVILKDAAATAAILSLSVDGCAIQDLEIEGENGNTGDGIEIKAGRCRLTNVAVYSMGNDGIRIGTAAGQENCNLWCLNNVKSKSNGRDGIRIDDAGAVAGSANANGGTATLLDLQSNTGSGLYLGNAQLNTFVGVVSQTNTANGYHLTANADNNAFFGGDPELNSNKDILIDAGATDNKFVGIPVNAATVTDNGTRTLLFLSDTYGLARGLTFPATQVSSTNVNTLDDYEEGTWEPTYVTTGTDFDAVTYDALRGGRYRKVGSLVHIQGTLSTDSITVGSATGTVRIGGLPFAAVASTGSTGDGNSTIAIGLASDFTGEEPISGVIIAGASVINLYYRSAVDGATTATAIADMNTGANSNILYFSGSYVAAA